MHTTKQINPTVTPPLYVKGKEVNAFAGLKLTDLKKAEMREYNYSILMFNDNDISAT
jgi:hypothetical protein